MTTVHLAGIGFLAPGFTGWPAARAVLAGEVAYACAPIANPSPEVLPAAERRRAGGVVRLALAVAQEAIAASGLDAAEVASVFVSSDGDGENVHQVCQGLAANALEISPTRFHNSVQNAPSGYWSIATGCRAPTNTISGFDTMLAQGLLEAVLQCAVERIPTVLIAYDLPMPAPLFALRPLGAGCGVAMVLVPEPRTADMVTLSLEIVAPAAPTAMRDTALEALRCGNPAARVLPLLEAIANRRRGRVILEFDPFQSLAVALG